MTPKRTLVVARVRSNKGFNQRLEIITAADVAHLFALAMNYRPDVAFAMGVISRSVPEVQAGDADISVDAAKKAIKLAELISHCRVTDTLPENPTDCDAVISAAKGVHSIEEAYTQLCNTVPGLKDSLLEQYDEWVSSQIEKDQPRKRSYFRGLFQYFRSRA